MEMAEPARMEREELGERDDFEPRAVEREEQAFQPMQPMQQPQGQLGQAESTLMAEGQLAMRKGEESMPIREVVLVPERGNRANLVFFSRDVDCATVVANPSAEPDFVMMVPVQADAQGTVREGAVAAGRWTVRGDEEGRTQTMRGQRGWITITSADDQRIEGDVTVSTTVQRQEVELNGPFTATICESTPTAGQPGMQQQPQQDRPGAQSPQNQNQGQQNQNQHRNQPSPGTSPSQGQHH